MMPEEATVAGLVIARGPRGCGAMCASNWLGLAHSLGSNPGTGMSATASHTGTNGSSASEPCPCGNVTVCGSFSVLVTQFTVSPGLTLSVPGSISTISTYCVAVPAVAVMVWVPSELSWTEA